jgi:hypothetical protein
MEQEIRVALREFDELAVDVNSLDIDSNLADAGLTFLGQIAVILALEENCDLDLTDHLLNYEKLESIRLFIKLMDQHR